MNVFGGHECNGILQARANIFNLKLRVVVSNNLREGETFIEQLEDVLHGDACASDTRLAEMDLSLTMLD